MLWMYKYLIQCFIQSLIAIIQRLKLTTNKTPIPNLLQPNLTISNRKEPNPILQPQLPLLIPINSSIASMMYKQVQLKLINKWIIPK